MTIYDEVNTQLEDKDIDAAKVAAIGHYTGLDYYYVELVDGTEKSLSPGDYRILDANLEAMLQEDMRNRAAENN